MEPESKDFKKTKLFFTKLDFLRKENVHDMGTKAVEVDRVPLTQVAKRELF